MMLFEFATLSGAVKLTEDVFVLLVLVIAAAALGGAVLGIAFVFAFVLLFAAIDAALCGAVWLFDSTIVLRVHAFGLHSVVDAAALSGAIKLTEFTLALLELAMVWHSAANAAAEGWRRHALSLSPCLPALAGSQALSASTSLESFETSSATAATSHCTGVG